MDTPLEPHPLLPAVTHPEDVKYLWGAIQAQIQTSPVDAGDVLTMLAYLVAAVLCGPQVDKGQRRGYWIALKDMVDVLLFEQQLEEA